MNHSAQLHASRLPMLLWLGVLLVAVIIVTGYTVTRGLMGALVVLPFVAAITLPWHQRLSFLITTACFQSALIVPLAPGPLSLWMAGCLPAWTGLVLAIIFRRTPEDLFQHLRQNRLLFLGLAVYCLNLFVILQFRGFGLNVLGGSQVMGGKFPLEQFLCAILPLAFLCMRTDEREVALLYRLQLVLSATFVVSEFVVTWAPGQAQYLFYFFTPSSDMLNFAAAEFVSFARYQSFKLFAPALLMFVMVSTPISRFASIHGLYLVPVCAGLFGLSLLSGHREAVILPLFVITTYLAGLRFFRVPTLALLSVAFVFGYVLLAFVVDDLPLAVQRSISFLPGIRISEVAAMDAGSTASLRWELTKFGWRMVPDHLLVGRGFLMQPMPTMHEAQNLLANHVWRGHFYNGFIGLLIHTGLAGTVAALSIYAGGGLLALRVFRRLRLSGANSVFDRVAAMLASYCIAKPIYFLLVNGNSMVAMQEFMLPIALLLVCERLLVTRGTPVHPGGQTAAA